MAECADTPPATPCARRASKRLAGLSAPPVTSPPPSRRRPAPAPPSATSRADEPVLSPRRARRPAHRAC
ncbi:hypothetical protein WJX81_005581 [Elliptochloris bilobata]|uniref:Uncharacterized protein n=1 Tax=Elliptochloris bilobata TaxID=381761 RepID=A0AAW1S1M5_9CHLO